MHPLGAALLLTFGMPLAAVFGVLHGAGNGILTIAKGTLPLLIFGAAGYGRRQGRLTVPARIAQALAPWVFGLCVSRWGTGALWLTGALGVSALAALLALRRPTESLHGPAADQPCRRRSTAAVRRSSGSRGRPDRLPR